MGLGVLTGAMTIAAYSVWFERKFAARMQNRPGPTEVGPVGLLQPLADLAKLVQKEHLVPAAADRTIFNIAPVLVVLAPLVTLAVIPFSPGIVGSTPSIGLL